MLQHSIQNKKCVLKERAKSAPHPSSAQNQSQVHLASHYVDTQSKWLSSQWSFLFQ